MGPSSLARGMRLLLNELGTIFRKREYLAILWCSGASKCLGQTEGACVFTIYVVEFSLYFFRMGDSMVGFLLKAVYGTLYSYSYSCHFFGS